MSLRAINIRYPKLTKWVLTAMPLVIGGLWLTCSIGWAQADGQPPSTSGGGPMDGTIPVVGTSLSAAGAFYWLISFLQNTIQRHDAEKASIYQRWEEDKENTVKHYEYLLTRKDEQHNADMAHIRNELKAWTDRYDAVTKDSIQDARSTRLPQVTPGGPKPTT